MTASCHAQLRRMSVVDLEKVLSWRNHPEVRRYMFTQHEIGIDEHALWFDRVSQDSNRHLLIFESQGIASGFINIYQDTSSSIADWGFYISPDAPKGTGRQLGNASLQYAFTTMRCNKLSAQVLSYNERSIRFHQNLGFKQEDILRQKYFDGKNFHDVVCFGIFSKEWRMQN